MGERERLPTDREGMTVRIMLGKHKMYITANTYPDGRLGEFFVKMDKPGSERAGFIDAWAISCSMLLQHGVPLEDIVAKFRNMQFPPSGATNLGFIATSPVDCVMRYLERRFL